MEQENIIKEVFEIAMHSIQTEELFLKQRHIETYTKDIEHLTATAIDWYERDIALRGKMITRKRDRLYWLLDEFYKQPKD